MAALVVLHALVAALAPLLSPRLGRRVFLWCAVAPAAAAAWALWHAPSVVDGEVLTQSITWVPELGLTLSFRFDTFSLLMVALVSGVGLLVFLYASSYFAGSERPKLGVFAAELTLFAGAMFGLVTADNLFLIFVFWELTAITSYFLIGYDDDRSSAREAARQAILITSAGGLALLAGFVLLSQAAGTASLHELLASPPSGGVVPAALVLVLIGAMTKSAQVPFHSWLPSAMEAPTPVSAYLHSATMVKAGIYLVARFSPAFAGEAVWRPLVLTIGVATMLVGGYRALRQTDLKLLLAYGTISQLGFMFLLFGTGSAAAIEAGAALLLAHGLFKAALFLTVGIVDHQAHTRDLRELSGLGRRLPVLAAAAGVAAASMAGIPLLFGFVAKELALESYIDGPLGVLANTSVLVGIVVGSILTVAYSCRFVWGAFATKPVDAGAVPIGPAVARPTRPFVAPVLLLGAVTIVLGVVPALAAPLVFGAARALEPSIDSGTLALWHGLSAALGLSAITWAAGGGLFAARVPVARLQSKLPAIPGSQRGYRGSIALLNRTAGAVTGVVQSGSLPTYLAIIVATVLLAPGLALALGGRWPDELLVAESPMQLVVVGLLVVTGISTVLVRRRFVAVLLVGAVGYLVGILFVIQGGPDLALTQFLVETLTVVVFVLVLRHLPERFSVQGWRLANAGRAAVAIGLGTFVTLFTLVAGGSRGLEGISEGLVDRALSEGGGRNVVNVVLTDFRALDTLGEISVLTVAALGITSLLLAGRGRRAPESSVGAEEPE